MASDRSGQTTLRNALLEAQYIAIESWNIDHWTKCFSFTGPAIRCDQKPTDAPYNSTHFPYPATENWQKAIGAHDIWLSATVQVQANHRNENPQFIMDFTLYAEDQYNFNSESTDIATGALDDDNGRFVVVGFAKGYRHNAIPLRRSIKWTGMELGIESMGITNPNINQRQHMPNNNRPIWNKL